ncbi:uncharacterized protein LOC144450123 [Glandiceps talaboti]
MAESKRLSDVGSQDQPQQKRVKFDPFMVKLVNLSKEISPESFQEMKILCNNLLPTGDLDKMKIPGELFVKLYQRNLIDESNTTALEDLLCSVHRKDLVEKFLKNKSICRPADPRTGNVESQPTDERIVSDDNQSKMSPQPVCSVSDVQSQETLAQVPPDRVNLAKAPGQPSTRAAMYKKKGRVQSDKKQSSKKGKTSAKNKPQRPWMTKKLPEKSRRHKALMAEVGVQLVELKMDAKEEEEEEVHIQQRIKTIKQKIAILENEHISLLMQYYGEETQDGQPRMEYRKQKHPEEEENLKMEEEKLRDQKRKLEVEQEKLYNDKQKRKLETQKRIEKVKEETIDKITAIFYRQQQAIMDGSDPDKMQQLGKAYKQYKATLDGIEDGSLLFYLSFLSPDDLDYFWQRHQTGAVQQILSDILITPEMKAKAAEAGYEVRMVLRINARQYERLRKILLGYKMSPTALIVCEKLGSQFEGDSTGGIYLLVRLLQEMGMTVHATVLNGNKRDRESARKLGVKLIYPTPMGRYAYKTPNTGWLVDHEHYFPNLKDVEDVRFVFGVSILRCNAALKIHSDLFPWSSLFMINLLHPDAITPITAGCQSKELQIRWKKLRDEVKKSNAVFSIGSDSFQGFRAIYKPPHPDMKHFELSPIPDEKFYNLPTLNPKSTAKEFNILSLLDPNEVENLKSDSILVRAMNWVAEKNFVTAEKITTWRILGVPAGDEPGLIARLQPHSKLKIVPGQMSTTEHIERELSSSHLVLIPPSKLNYVNFTLAAMCAEIPVIMACGTPSHTLVTQHMGLYSYRLVVDMIEGPHDLQERIFHICRKYKLALRRAKEVRFTVQQIVEQRLKDVNKDFIELVTTELQDYQDTSNIEVDTPESGKMTSQDLSDDITLDNDARGQEQRRKPCEITVKIEINSCIPLKGNTVSDVDDEFCKILRQNTTLPRKLGEIHPGLAVKHRHHGNGCYVMECQSREALDCLMEEYGSKRLSEMVETTLIIEADLDDIGFTYISLDTRIDYKEYLTCKDELPEPVAKIQRRHSFSSLRDLHRVQRSKPIHCRVLDELNLIPAEDAMPLIPKLVQTLEEQPEPVAKIQRRHSFSSLRDLHPVQHSKPIHSRVLDELNFIPAEDAMPGIPKLVQTLEEQTEPVAKIQRRHSFSSLRDLHRVQHSKPIHCRVLDELNLIPVEDVMPGIPELVQTLEGMEIIDVTRKFQKDLDIQLVMDRLDRLKEDGIIARLETNMQSNMNSEMKTLKQTLKSEIEKTDKDEHSIVLKWVYARQDVRKGKEIADKLIEEKAKLTQQAAEPTDTITLLKEKLSSRDQYIREITAQLDRVNHGLPQKGTIRVFTGEDTQAGKLREPIGLFVRNNGDFVVTDIGRVSVYDCQFHCKHIIQFNSFDEKFYPVDVFVSKDGIFYIPDYNNNSLVICNEDSKIKDVLQQLTYQNRSISPKAVCVSMGYIYTIDYEYVYCIDGESHDVIKSSQLTTGGFLRFICGNTKGNIMVSEYILTRSCIHILDKDLNTLTQLSHHLIKIPIGICTDDSDNLFVCEREENRILEFNVMGEFIGIICDGDDVKSPRDIAVNADCIAWTERAYGGGDECVKVLYR